MADTRNDAPEDARKRRLNENDWRRVAESIAEEAERRKGKRVHREKIWKEVDRQVRMEPLPLVDANGAPLAGSNWMSNLELPLQAQTLEVLTADARRLMFPDDRTEFSAHVAMDDNVLETIETDELIPGLSNEAQTFREILGTVTKIDQDDLNALIEGVIQHYHSLYDYRGMWDLLHADAFKHGTFAARAKIASHDDFDNDFRGVIPERFDLPALIPRPIRNVYLDDTVHAVMHEGLFVSPSFIENYWQKLDDLKIAAKKGSRDATKENAGWMPQGLKDVEPLDIKHGMVELLEYEGDLLVPRSEGPAMFLPNVIVTVVIGKGGPKVVRYRERRFAFRSYLIGHYHRSDIADAYGDGPLMMGMPIHKAATDAFNRIMQGAALNTQPPVRWDPTDHYLEAQGGPIIEPNAQWPARTAIDVIEVGDITAMSNVYLALIKQYEDVTGVTVPRLGGQTKSHQTAFAVDSEITRGTVRTVDYVRSIMTGAYPSWLAMEYEMIRKIMPDRLNVFLPKYKAWVQVRKEHLPKNVTFEVHGAAGPLEQREKLQKRLLALQQAVQLEIAKRQLGEGQPLNIETLQRFILKEGGFTDVDALFAGGGSGAAQPLQGATGVPVSPGVVSEQPGNAVARLASLAR